jgi:hypothetical protein
MCGGVTDTHMNCRICLFLGVQRFPQRIAGNRRAFSPVERRSVGSRSAGIQSGPRSKLSKERIKAWGHPLPGGHFLRRTQMIQIKKSPTADTRTCDFSKVSKATLAQSSSQHIYDVRHALEFFVESIRASKEVHDFDKITDIDGFHHDFVTGFKETTWWDNHRKVNRHHLLDADGVPADVNLIDVLETIADCVMAGMARSGSVYPLNIKPEVLQAAFDNTVELLKSNVKVTE